MLRSCYTEIARNTVREVNRSLLRAEMKEERDVSCIPEVFHKELFINEK